MSAKQVRSWWHVRSRLVRHCFVLFGAFIYSVRPRKPSTGPLAPQAPADLPPDEPPAPGPEPPRPGAWRSVHQRGGFRRTRKKSEPRPAGPVIETPMQPPAGPPPDRAQAAGSWATWQGKPPSLFFTSLQTIYNTHRQCNLVSSTRRRQVNPRFI